ncbi:MAG: hypothetical protein M0036_00085 [Desulfobacteraceae bacterium]|nr:hypothetical protein [Desulfobacteraceae bacterium]
MSRSKQIAVTIYEQLGGGRMRVMIGFKDGIALENGLQFGFKGCRKANKCVVRLSALDLYDVVFYHANLRNIENPCPEVGRFESVYADKLVGVFEEFTGLRTRLF